MGLNRLMFIGFEFNSTTHLDCLALIMRVELYSHSLRLPLWCKKYGIYSSTNLPVSHEFLGSDLQFLLLAYLESNLINSVNNK